MSHSCAALAIRTRRAGDRAGPYIQHLALCGGLQDCLCHFTPPQILRTLDAFPSDQGKFRVSMPPLALVPLFGHTSLFPNSLLFLTHNSHLVSTGTCSHLMISSHLQPFVYASPPLWQYSLTNFDFIVFHLVLP